MYVRACMHVYVCVGMCVFGAVGVRVLGPLPSENPSATYKKPVSRALL